MPLDGGTPDPPGPSSSPPLSRNLHPVPLSAGTESMPTTPPIQQHMLDRCAYHRLLEVILRVLPG
jgi:hypothetical protein